MTFTAEDYRLNLKIFDNQLFSFHMKALRFAGYVIDENEKSECWPFLRSVFVALSIAVCCALNFIKLITKDRGSGMCPATALLYLTLFIALINTCFRRKRLARMLAFLQDDVDKLLMKSDQREEKLFEETHKYMHKITVSILTNALVAGTIILIDTLYRFAFNPDSIFNLELHNGTSTETLLIKVFPIRELHDGLCFGYILPMYFVALGATTIPLWHTFITSLMSYVILKWRIMHKRLSEMDISKVILEPHESRYLLSIAHENDRTNYLRTRVCKFYVMEQLRIRWFIRELQQLICIPVFADFLICSILICFLFYEMAIGNPTNTDFLVMVLYLFVLSAILFLYHWHATIVKECSEQMSFAIYSSDWYNYSIEVQKLIQLIMTISADPLEMKAVFVSLNLTTFIDIIRASYSYFSVLKNTS